MFSSYFKHTHTLILMYKPDNLHEVIRISQMQTVSQSQVSVTEGEAQTDQKSLNNNTNIV